MLNDDDAPLNKTMQALGFASTAATSEDTHQTVVLLTGGPGSGKTTGLLRIARQLIGAGTNPFLFRKDEYVDVDATIEWLQAVPRTVLLFDDCADFSSTIEQLAERCKAQGTRILMIGAERSSSITTSVQGGMWGDARMAARRLAWERLARSLLSCVSSSHRSNSVGPNRSRGSISRTTR